MKIHYRISLLAVLVLACELSGQTTGRRRSPTRPDASAASRSSAVRAELAAVLLESGKYSDAAREYRWLIGRDSRNTSHRLGLVRALAWGGRYRDAEPELRVLASLRPGDPAVEELQQLVRTNLEPGSREARQWVFERPHYAPYRIALARALLREGQARAAIAQYDTLVARNPTPLLLGEVGNAYAAARDRAGGIAYVRGVVARAPADTGFRRAFADLLVADRQYAAAIAQSDTIVFLARTPGTLAARARVNIAAGDLGSAERDLSESLAIRPTAEAYLLLGDTYRWRGEFGRARTAYGYARVMKRDRTVTAAFAQLARDERAVLALEPAPITEQGWQTNAATNADNAGVYYSTVEFRRGFGLGHGFVGGASLEVRQLRETNAATRGALGGYATDLAIAREGIQGPFYGRAGGSIGLVFHPLAKTVGAATLALTGRYYAWGASFDLSTGPAYPSLRTLASVVPLGEGSRPLTAVTTAVSIAGPVGRSDVAVGLRSAAISDGNHRTELQGYARFPFTPTLSAVYWGNTIAFAQTSREYWAPQSFSSNALGLELAARQLRGWSLILRALPGAASTDNSPFVRTAAPDTSTLRLRFQMSTGGELAYRHPRWESAITFGWGRVASYSRTEASVRLTLIP